MISLMLGHCCTVKIIIIDVIFNTFKSICAMWIQPLIMNNSGVNQIGVVEELNGLRQCVKLGDDGVKRCIY